MTPLQLEFFKAADNHQKQAEKERNRQRRFVVGGLITGLVLTTGLAVFAVFQLQQVQRQRAEQLAATAQAQLSSQSVDAQVNAIAAIGLDRSPFVNFPNHPLSASIQGSLLDVIRVNKEQNQLQDTDTVYSVAFSPDGKQIVSGSRDNTVQLWNAATGQPIGKPLTGHTSTWDTPAVFSVAFSPNGKQIVSASGDNTVRLWNAATGQPIGKPLIGHTSVVTSVAFSPDGKQIVSGSYDKTVRLWDVSWESWLQTACKQLRHHPILVNPETDVAKEAEKTCVAFETQR